MNVNDTEVHLNGFAGVIFFTVVMSITYTVFTIPKNIVENNNQSVIRELLLVQKEKEKTVYFFLLFNKLDN
jgi:hypothetical protein